MLIFVSNFILGMFCFLAAWTYIAFILNLPSLYTDIIHVSVCSTDNNVLYNMYIHVYVHKRLQILLEAGLTSYHIIQLLTTCTYMYIYMRM